MASEYTRLPTWVLPQHYSLSLFKVNNPEPWIYHGRVQIAIVLQRETTQITLHARYLKLHTAEALVRTAHGDETVPAVETTYDAPNHRCTLSFEKALPVTTNDHVVLSIRFQGLITDDLVGFYRSSYELPDQGKRFMCSTQFQPCEARRAFPCFDEPAMKATFDFDIEIPASMTALSNMPVKEVKPSSRANGYNVVFFERTPRMSSYLLAWAIGDLEHIEVQTSLPSGRVLPIRLYTTPGLTSRGRFALSLAEKIVPYFAQQFQLEYPLPKLDLIAVPDMADSMENWGLLAFETIALLFDEQTADPSSRTNVAVTVAHEIAHQWFGNLVTMEWWEDLWLNEGFATWAGWSAADHFIPEWNIWAEWVGEGMQEGLDLDALRSSHPIHVPVLDDLEVDSIFDSISYEKGCALIRTLVSYLGRDVFLQGVSTYLKRHSYGNTKAEDLWTALSEACGQDLLPLVKPWVQQMGFPALTVVEDTASTAVQLRQQSFHFTHARSEDHGSQALWRIPVTISNSIAAQILFSTNVMELGNQPALDRPPNQDYAGFFRTNFSPAQLSNIASNIHQLTVTERVGLVRDVSAFAAAQDSSFTTPMLLDFLATFRHEQNAHVWGAILSSISFVQSMFSHNTAISAGLDKFVVHLISDTAYQLGWTDSHSSPDQSINYLPGEMRATLILALGLAGDERIAAESTKRFKQFFDGERSAIPLSLQQTVFQISVRHMGREAYDMLRKEYLQTTSDENEKKILTSIGQGVRPELVNDFLRFVLSEDVSIQNAGAAANALAANIDVKVRELLWAFIVDQWDMIFARLGGSMVVFERFVRGSLETLASLSTQNAIEDFFKKVDTTGYTRGIAVALEKIENNAAYIQRDSKILEDYFRKKD